jgi:hypothetical protein
MQCPDNTNKLCGPEDYVSYLLIWFSHIQMYVIKNYIKDSF